jgi:DNA-binding MarR family transcriptional regulator
MPLPPHRHRTDAARSLVAVAPLVTRWIERVLAAHDPPLTPPQYLALRAIGHERVSVTELARRAGVSGPAASQLVNALADADLVHRRSVPDDRRRHELALSPPGERTLRSAETLLTTRVSELLEDLPHPEIDALARALPAVEATLAGTAPPRRPPPPPPPPSHPPGRHPPPRRP